MSNLIIISGPQAVGKMTVAEVLKDRIGYSLMVNHDTIEVSDKIFGMATPAQKELNMLMRDAVYDTAIKYGIDLILTFVISYDRQDNIDGLNEIRKKFEESGGTFYYVELYADVETRLKRNVTPHRLESKLSKNNIEWSNNDLINKTKEHRLNTYEGETICPNHLKIDNTNLSPEEVVDIIIKEFDLYK